MTAREKFKKGDLVVMNASTPRTTFQKQHGLYLTGRVVGFGRLDHLVRVKWDARKTIHCYWMGFVDNLRKSDQGRTP